MKNENWEEEGREKRKNYEKDYYHRVKKFKPQTEKDIKETELECSLY